jgi:hypothetical protein
MRIMTFSPDEDWNRRVLTIIKLEPASQGHSAQQERVRVGLLDFHSGTGRKN